MTLVNKLNIFILKYNIFVKIILYIFLWWLFPILFIIDLFSNTSEIDKFLALTNDIINKKNDKNIILHLKNISKYVKRDDEEGIKTEISIIKQLVDKKYIKYLNVAQIKILKI